MVNLNKLVKTELGKYAKILEDKEIKTVVEENGAYMRDCDRAKMTKVLHNLLSNSVRHCTVGGEISIRIGESRVEIENEGEAIPEDKLEHIWKAYYKIDEARNRNDAGGGTGLGLAIVKHILELHQLQCGITNTENGVAVWFGK